MTGLIPSVAVGLGGAVIGIGRMRKGSEKRPLRNGPPPLLGVRRPSEYVPVEQSVDPRQAAEDASELAATIVTGALAEEAAPAAQYEAVEQSPVVAQDVPRTLPPRPDVVVVLPPNVSETMPSAERVLLPSRDGSLRAAATVKAARRVTAQGQLVTDPIVLDKHGMLGVVETEELPPVDGWEATRTEREAAFLAARKQAEEEEAQVAQENERREIAARAAAQVEIERQREAERGWWVQLDPEVSTEVERIALVSSLVGVKMDWARRVLLRAMREDKSTRVRARAIGAMARAGFLDDSTPFDEVLKENDRVLNVAIREALMPHQDRLWVRNLFA